MTQKFDKLDEQMCGLFDAERATVVRIYFLQVTMRHFKVRGLELRALAAESDDVCARARFRCFADIADWIVTLLGRWIDDLQTELRANAIIEAEYREVDPESDVADPSSSDDERLS